MTAESTSRRSTLKAIGTVALTALAGSASSLAHAQNKPIVIGMPIAQSGPAGVADHVGFWSAAKLAVKDINDAGGVKGRLIELKVVDMDLLTPEGTQAAVRRLIDAKVNAIVSPFYVVGAAAAEAGAGYKAPFLHGSASSEMENLVLKNPVRYGHMFQTVPVEVLYGSGFAVFLEDLKASGTWKPINNKVHIIREDLAYAKNITKSAEAQLKARGKFDVVKVTDVQLQVSDWGPAIQELHATGAGVIMVNHAIAADLAAFSKQYAANPVRGALVYLQYGPSQPEYLTLAGPAAEGFVWSSLAGVLADQQGQAYREKYRSAVLPKGGTMGMAYTGNGNDVVRMLADAWTRADADNFPAVVAELRKTRYRGVNGVYNFDSAKQSTLSYPQETSKLEEGMPHLFYQVQGGQHRIIRPNAVKEVAFRESPWMR